MIKPEEIPTLYQKLKSHIARDFRPSAVTQNTIVGGGGATSFSGLTGTIANAQAPQFLLRDGSRSLTGSLSVDAGVTIDGIDISAHAADANAHHNQQHSVTGGDHTITGAALSLVGATAINTLGLIAPSSNPGTTESVLKATSGLLTLPNFTATTSMRAPLIDTASGALTLQPAGTDVVNINTLLTGGFGARATTGTLDWNDATNARPGSGHSLMQRINSINAPPNPPIGAYFHPFSFEYATKTGAGNITQFAIPYATAASIDAGVHVRGRYLGTWTNWAKLISENTSGNVLVGTYTDGGYKFDVTGTARITTSLTTPLLTTASNVDLVINPAGTGAVQFPNDQTLRTSSFDSSFPINGWQINEVAGVAGYSALTIGKIQADELAVRVFVADEVRVDRGDEFWTKSYGIIAATFTTPSAIGGTVSVKFEDSPALAGAIFVNNDWVLIRKLEIDTGINLFNVWGQVATYVNNSDGTQNWTFTLRSGPTSTEITKGSLAIDFGASGAALIHLSVIDAAGAPYIKMRKWSGANPYTPANFTTYVQLGHLGSTGNAFVTPAGFGLYARSTANEAQFIVADDNGLQLRGADFKEYNGANQTVNIASADGSVKLGTNIASSSTTGFEFNGATGAVTIGNASYPGTVTVYGSITVTGGNAAKTDFSNITATIDNVPNGTTYARTTPNQVTGAGRAFTALSSGNNLVTSVIPATAIGNPGVAGLYLGSDYMGYHTGSGTSAGWKTYMDSSGNFKFAGSSATNYIQWAAASNKLQGVGGGVEQWYADATDGKIYAGGGLVGMDSSGLWLRMNANAAWATTNAVTFRNASAFSTIDAVLSTLTVTGSRYLNLLIDPDSTPVGMEIIKSSTAQRVNITHDLTVQRDANILGALTVNGTAVTLVGQTLPLSGGTLTGTLTSRTVAPSANNTYDIGSSSNYFNNGYIRNLYTDTIVGTPSYAHSHAASDITSGTLDFARMATTWTGALTLDADSAGTSNYVRWLTQTSTGKAWDFIGRAHDFATAAQQNDLLLTYYDGSTTHVVLQADNATRIVNFGQTPTVGGTVVSLSGHAHDDRYFTETESDARYVQTATLNGYLLADGTRAGATSQAQVLSNGVQVGLGSAAAPSISFVGDTDSGLMLSAANKLGFVTNATEWATLDSAGLFTVAKTLTAGWVRNSMIGFGGQGANDLGMLGFYDRNELTNADLRGTVTITITGAGTVTTSTINNAFNALGNFMTITGTDNTTTQIVFHVDLGANQSNYGSAFWQPFLQYRLTMNSVFTHYRTIVCEVSTDNATWYKPSGGLWETTSAHTSEIVPGLWLGQNGNPSIPGNTYRYVRFTLTNRFEDAGYSSKASVWISQVGLRHYAARTTRAWMHTSGDTMYGQLLVNATSSGAFDVRTAGASSIFKVNTSSAIVTVTGDLDVSDNLLLAAGSASLPALAGSADTNTGLYWSAADVLAVTTGGVQRATFSSAGLAVPTSVSAPSLITASGTLTIAPANSTTAVTGALSLTGTLSSTSWNITSAGAATVVTAAASTKVTTPLIDTASGNLSIAPSGTTIATFTAAALGVGTSTPEGLQVQSALTETSRGVANVRLGVMAGTPRVNLDDGANQWQIDNSAGLLRFFRPGNVLLDVDSSGNTRLHGGNIGSGVYASQANGWRVTGSGGADFRYIYTDELHAKAFIADLEQALAGGQIIAKSVTLLHEDFRTPYFGGKQRITVKDLPSAPGMQVFQANDHIALRSFARASGELLIGYAWGTVTDPADNANGTQTWTFNRSGTSTYSTITQRGTATSATTAAGTSVAPTKPTGVVSGDVLVAVVTHDGTADTITATGWILLGAASGTDIHGAIYYKVAGGAEGASYTFSTASSHALAASVVAYSNVDTTYTPIDDYSIQANAVGANMAAATVWCSSTAGRAVFLGGVSNSSSATIGGAFTELIDTGATGIRVYVAHAANTVAGETGSVTATISSSSHASIGAMVMLRPQITVFYDAQGGGVVPGSVIGKDAIIVDYGVSGNGYYEVNAADGLNAENSPYSQIVTWTTHPGPAGNRKVRSRWGNLNGLAIADYGLVMGIDANSPTTTTFDFRASTGNLTLGANGGAIVLEGGGNSYFSGVMTIGSAGGIYQGSGTFASPTTGLKIWNSSGIGRIGGYNAGTVQWYANTDGKLYAGGGNALLDSSGISVIGDGVFRIMENSSTLKGTIYSSNPLDSLILNSTGVGVKTNGTSSTEGISLRANATSGNTTELALNASSSGGMTVLVYPNGTSTAGQMQLTKNSFTLALNGTGTTDFSVNGSGDTYLGGGLAVGNAYTPAAASISAGSVGVDYSPTSGNWNTSGSTLLLNGLNHTTIGFHDSDNRVDFIRVGAGLITLGYNGGFGAANVAVGGTVRTAAGVPWDLGGYTGGALTATGYVSVTINGVAYKLLAST